MPKPTPPRLRKFVIAGSYVEFDQFVLEAKGGTLKALARTQGVQFTYLQDFQTLKRFIPGDHEILLAAGYENNPVYQQVLEDGTFKVLDVYLSLKELNLHYDPNTGAEKRK